MKKILSLTLMLLLLIPALAGCYVPQADLGGTNTDGQEPQDTIQVVDGDTQQPASLPKSDAELFTDRDGRTQYDESKSIKIELRGTTAAASAGSVNISGSTVTLTQDATYIISGTLDNGQIIVNAPDTAKLQLVFKGVNITSAASAPLYIIQADKVFLTLVGENTLANGGAFEAMDDNNIDGAIFSKQDLTINGSGSLAVTSPAGHGIVCKDDLVLYGGTYTVNSASHALQANDSIRIKDAHITAVAGKDGLHAENSEDTSLGFIYMASGTLNITAEGDGVSAGGYLQIREGTTAILAGGGYENGDAHSSGGWGNMPGGGFPGGSFGGGGGSRPGGRSASSTTTTDDTGTSMKGLKAAGSILIEGGTFQIDSADDAIHSNTSLTVSGGSFEIASGDDALHAEDTLTVNSGDIDISTCYEGLEALHIYVKGGHIKLVATDDGLNAAGGTDQSGMGGRDEMFGGSFGGGSFGGGSFGGGGFGGFGGMGGSSNGSIVVSGGTLYINSSGDGMDANGTLEITGGHTTVVGPTQGDTAVLDYDKTGTITGGTFIGTGSSMMAQSLDSSTQGVIALSVGSQSAGTKITVADTNGNVLVTRQPELSYQIVIISSPDIKSGEKYTVTVGSQSGEFEAQ